ncbi:MAG TPA: hypothetical protein PLS00_14040 [Niabella sp.]|uniref:hypothetical protein n=1 Tax=Agriterribacter sp. TaxID=2821509 RepID=UPI002CAD86A1|nr:hypothetical protein [Agriterribacter sp.]HRN46954.1 hypothetical protein [Niabella sp.]HRO46740.1 hypothetical protein [Agriterribacter sp.]HUN03974.1 hypothetical protein [Niabella sp.]
MKNENTSNPLEHTSNVKKEFDTLIDHLRRDVEKMDDPSGKALFEVCAEVITGLKKAFTDYEQKNEPAWKN